VRVDPLQIKIPFVVVLTDWDKKRVLHLSFFSHVTVFSREDLSVSTHVRLRYRC